MVLDEAQRSAALDKELLRIAGNGGRIVARTPTAAVVSIGKPVNHVLHLLITVLLCGLWLPVWILEELTGGEGRRTVAIDENGRPYNPDPPQSRLRVPVMVFGIWGAIMLVVLLLAVLRH